mmetsp:Transcript_1273/g.3090  ORF Transcript_1273/g.3090 Transcript_1273/m.3090 type:complete len:245 (+) Transcript_1273:393-1127(+)
MLSTSTTPPAASSPSSSRSATRPVPTWRRARPLPQPPRRRRPLRPEGARWMWTMGRGSRRASWRRSPRRPGRCPRAGRRGRSRRLSRVRRRWGGTRRQKASLCTSPTLSPASTRTRPTAALCSPGVPTTRWFCSTSPRASRRPRWRATPRGSTGCSFTLRPGQPSLARPIRRFGLGRPTGPRSSRGSSTRRTSRGCRCTPRGTTSSRRRWMRRGPSTTWPRASAARACRARVPASAWPPSTQTA